MTQPTAPADGRKIATLAALHMLYEGVGLGMIPTPQAVHTHTHDLSHIALLQYADYYEAKVQVFETHASITTSPLTTLKHDVEVRVTMYSSDVSDEARVLYEHHNTECFKAFADPALVEVEYDSAVAAGDADPCADGKCTDPEMHAEGGHDR